MWDEEVLKVIHGAINDLKSLMKDYHFNQTSERRKMCPVLLKMLEMSFNKAEDFNSIH